MPRQQRVGNNFGQPPAAGNRQQMLLALGLGDLDQVFRAQARRFRQHRARDRDLVVARQAADDGRRRLRDAGQLQAGFRQRDPGADISDRPDLDGPDQAFEHAVEQLDLFAVEAAGRGQKQLGHTLDRLQALFRGAEMDRLFDFIDDRLFGIQHRSS